MSSEPIASSAPVTTVAGDQAVRAISRAVAGFPEVISYVRAEVLPSGARALPPNAPPTGAWISCQQLLTEDDWLATVIRATGGELGTDDDVVAASLFVQNYSYRMLMVAVACMTVAGVVPDVQASAMAITLSKGRPFSVGFVEPAALLLQAAATDDERPFEPSALGAALSYLYERVVEENLVHLVRSTRRRVRVGERLLWGNVAASAAVAFRTMDGCLGPWVQPIGQQFFDNAPSVLRGLGSFLVLEHQGRRGWYWERTNCCLYDRLPGKIRCADCSRTPTAPRRAAYLASLSQGCD